MKNVPTDIEIELALARSGGSCRGAARILGCTARVAKYVRQQNSDGRKLGRLKPRKSRIEIEVNGNTPCCPVTDFDREYDAMMQEFMAEELAS